MDGQLHPATRRVLEELGDPELPDRLASLAGSDLTTLLLEVMRRRAARVSPASVVRQYASDRFVAPAAVTFQRLRAAEDLAVEAVAGTFDLVTPSPVVPLGAHACLTGISQDRLVSATRPVEVAGDTTMALALEVAARRRAGSADVHLAAMQRVLRAQTFAGPRSFAHFSLFAVVSAGRDTGDQRFEGQALLDHLSVFVSVIQRAGASRVIVRMSDFAGDHERAVELARAHLPRSVEYERWDDRQDGRGYYPNVCFRIEGVWNGERIEVGDGGVVTWTQELLADRKERLVTSGLSLERIASVLE